MMVTVILDRHSRLNSAELETRLKATNFGDGQFPVDQITEFVNLMQVYEGAMYEISTKLEVLDEEFQVRFSHNPVHHIERRLKSISSILGKLERRELPKTVESIKDNLFDVAGVRVICNYRDDVYSVSNYLSAQSDIQVLRVKDYIKNPKQNGYRSLHVIYAVPVFLSSGAHYTPVEVQFRTIAMDYWASLEHALRYKTDLPDVKLSEHSQTLLDCARSLQNIEVQMQNIHRDINGRRRWTRPRTPDAAVATRCNAALLHRVAVLCCRTALPCRADCQDSVPAAEFFTIRSASPRTMGEMPAIRPGCSKE